MARPQARKRQRADPTPDQIPSKRARLIDACPRPSRRQNQRIQADEHPRSQVPITKANSAGTLPQPSRSQNRTKQADASPQHQTPSQKSQHSETVDRSSNFPPEFYDNLSKIWLTRRALKELDWRNKSVLPPKLVTRQKHIEDSAPSARKSEPDLARFARTGGPDLSDLRGYPEPASIAPTMVSASSSVTSRRVSAGSSRSTKPTTVSRRSSAYDANFGQHCIDHHIYPPVYKFPDGSRPPKPANFEELRQLLRVPRGSLSPSVVPEKAFEEFQDKNATRSEGTVMRTVVPLVAGDADILNEGNLPFTNLASMTENKTKNPVPDFYDGAHPGALDKTVRETLDKIIIPSKKGGIPIAPNFFLEAKGSGGTIEVAVRQAVLDGAHGALIMHTLQNYLVDEPVYDGNAYAFSSTLLDGYLNLYAHHLTAPATSGQGPCYFTTLLKAYALSDDEVYPEGRGAFRNLRMRAKEDRDRFIEVANARARGEGTEDKHTERDGSSSPIADCGSSPLDFYDCQMFAESRDADEEKQEAPGTNVGLAILHQPYEKDDADDTEASIGFAPSFTSSFTSVSVKDTSLNQRQTKLPRTPPSPSSTRDKKR